MRSFRKSHLKLFGALAGLICAGALFLGRSMVARATAHPAMAKANPAAHVWVDLAFGLYYCSDSAVYGRLSPGRNMTQAQAKELSFRPALGQPCQ
jgi:hypothetical protein